MVNEIRIVNDELEFESNELGDKRTLKQLSQGDFALHKTRHQKDGADEISLSGLAGASPVLATPVINTSISGSAIATGAEVVTGTSNTKIVTPKAVGDAGLGVDIFKFRRTGLYYPSSGITAGAYAATATSANNIDVFPFVVPVLQNFDRIAIYVSTLSAGNCRLGIYADNGDVCADALILDAGIVATGATGLKEIVISLALQPGLYWLAKVQDATPGLYGLNATDMLTIGSSDALAVCTGWRKAQAYGALPNPYGTPDSIRNGGQCVIFLRKAA